MSCPHTVAIVMDGNRRWAKKNNLPSASGHRKGIETLIDIVKTAKNNSIKRLVVYAFSTENWSRENFEVNALMNLINFGVDVKLDEIDNKMYSLNIGVNNSNLKVDWDKIIDETLLEAKLVRPKDGYKAKGGKNGMHTEHLGFLLAEMQFLQRAYPNAKW